MAQGKARRADSDAAEAEALIAALRQQAQLDGGAVEEIGKQLEAARLQVRTGSRAGGRSGVAPPSLRPLLAVGGVVRRLCAAAPAPVPPVIARAGSPRESAACNCLPTPQSRP